ncbi:MAG TPA: hypothetical protein VL359_07875, partial [bacterium]|nr:hypothetical protein [bacterium]
MPRGVAPGRPGGLPGAPGAGLLPPVAAVPGRADAMGLPGPGAGCAGLNPAGRRGAPAALGVRPLSGA